MVKIGVLGGIGPEASAEFYFKLIKKLQEKGLIKENADFPQVIINSIPAPELVGEINERDIVPYVDGLKELDNFKPDFIVMVCNTIHLFYGFLQKQIKSRIINLREEVRDLLSAKKTKSVFIIGTQSTIEKKLYEFKGIKSLKPSREEIEILIECIIKFNNGFEREIQVKRAREICLKYLNLGAEEVLLACTEFAVMLEKEDFPMTNSIDVLIDATIREFQSFKNKDEFRLA